MAKLTSEDKYKIIESQSALAFGITFKNSMIISWQRKYEKLDYKGLIDKKNGRPPTQYLKKLKILKRIKKLEKLIFLGSTNIRLTIIRSKKKD